MAALLRSGATIACTITAARPALQTRIVAKAHHAAQQAQRDALGDGQLQRRHPGQPPGTATFSPIYGVAAGASVRAWHEAAIRYCAAQ